MITGPSSAELPAMAIRILKPRTALNDPWVKYRWKPMLMPSPENR